MVEKTFTSVLHAIPGTWLVAPEIPLNVPKHSPDQLPGCFWIIQRDVVGYGVQITECGPGPDYFSHRAMRCLA